MANILVNGLALNDKFTGVQYYIENLVNAMNNISLHSMDINFLISSGYQGKAQAGPTVNLLRSKIDSKNRVKRICFENFQLRKFIGDKPFDLYHSPNYLLPFSPPLPSILTIHDVIALNYPEYSKNETVLYHRILQKRSLILAKRIIAVSHTVKNDIIRNYNIDEQKISVIYHGIKPNFKNVTCVDQLTGIRIKYALPSKYILFVGNIEPKKNLARLFKAFHLIKRNSDVSHKLVVVGKTGWKYQKIIKTIAALKLCNEIQFLGYVEESDLPSIYTLADLFVFPSLYEGFGIPPLEAMACETPVLVSKSGALPEVTGNVCQQVDPIDVADMARKIVELLNNKYLRDQTIAEGKQWVKNFVWEKAANQTMRLYEETVRSLNLKMSR